MVAEYAPDSELDRLRATLDITNTLLSAVASTDPVRALAARISTICHGTAIIYDFEGGVVASSGEAPVQLIWNEVSATHQRELALEIGRWYIRTRRVSLRDGVHVIAIASRSAEGLERIADLLLDTSERLLGAVHGIRYGASQRDRRDNEQLIASLHDGVVPAREHRFWSRLAQFRFPAYAPIRSVELATLDGRSTTETQITAIAARARAEDLPLLVMLRRTDVDSPATIAAILPESPTAVAWLDTTSRHFLVGASAPFSALSQVPNCVREAETALGIAREWAAATSAPERLGPVLTDRIDLSTWLLSHVDGRQLASRIERTLAALDDAPLRDTLTTYLASGLSVTGAAAALYVHPNTVRYRLARVEEALGESLSSAFTLSNLILALHPELIARTSELQPNTAPPLAPGEPDTVG